VAEFRRQYLHCAGCDARFFTIVPANSIWRRKKRRA